MDKLVTAFQDIFKAYIDANPSSLVGDVKKVFWGDPYRILLSDTPLIYVDLDGSGYQVNSGFDEVNVAMHVGYVSQIMEHIGSSNDDVNEMKKHVMSVLEGTDDNGDLKSDSILGIIRSNTTVSYDDGSGAINLAVDLIDYQTEYRESINDKSEVEMLEGIVNMVVKVIRSS